MSILAKKAIGGLQVIGVWSCVLGVSISWAQAQQPATPKKTAARAATVALRAEALDAMQRAATFYRTQVARHGGYVYHYDLDLRRSWGEGEATRDQIWVQPPGTPTVGLAYLAAYGATQDALYLEAATAAAEALCYGQLQSGGWTNCIDFNPQGERVALYRNGRGKGKNNSSLDDGQTSAALTFLIQADAAHGFRHPQIHQAVQTGLDSLLAAQYPNGAFPQVWSERRAAERPADNAELLRGNYPAYDWRTEGKIKDYWTLYTLNDGLAESVANTLRTAYEVYRDEKYLAAWRRLGDFLISAQMPEPQPAWAQQYNFDMQPVWARKFEPPAVSGHESQGVIRVLIDLYRATGDEKFLQPIPAALAYLQRSLLGDGRLARYYELRTNTPLYMERQGEAYHLTYDDSNLPDHYGWKVAAELDQLQAAYQAVRNSGPKPVEVQDRGAGGPNTRLSRVSELIAALDAQGRWISQSQGERLVGQKVFPPGTQYLASAVFSQNLTELAQFLQSSAPN